MPRHWNQPRHKPERMHDSLVEHVQRYQKGRTSLSQGYARELLILDDETSAVRLHRTNIVVFFKDKPYCRINNGGWQSITTKARINEYVPNLYLFSKSGSWYVDTGERTPVREIKCGCCHGLSPEFKTVTGRLAHLSCRCVEQRQHNIQWYESMGRGIPPYLTIGSDCRNCNDTGLVTVGGRMKGFPYENDMLIDMRTGKPYER